MALRPYRQPSSHRFDIVARDNRDFPVLIVELERNMKIRDHARILADTTALIDASARPAPFLFLANESTIGLYRKDSETKSWLKVKDFDTRDVLQHYDREYGENPVYEHYLASLIQVWLNDVADNWRSSKPPGAAIFEELGLNDLLRQAWLAFDDKL